MANHDPDQTNAPAAPAPAELIPVSADADAAGPAASSRSPPPAYSEMATDDAPRSPVAPPTQRLHDPAPASPALDRISIVLRDVLVPVTDADAASLAHPTAAAAEASAAASVRRSPSVRTGTSTARRASGTRTRPRRSRASVASHPNVQRAQANMATGNGVDDWFDSIRRSRKFATLVLMCELLQLAVPASSLVMAAPTNEFQQCPNLAILHGAIGLRALTTALLVAYLLLVDLKLLRRVQATYDKCARLKSFLQWSTMLVFLWAHYRFVQLASSGCNRSSALALGIVEWIVLVYTIYLVPFLALVSITICLPSILGPSPMLTAMVLNQPLGSAPQPGLSDDDIALLKKRVFVSEEAAAAAASAPADATTVAVDDAETAGTLPLTLPDEDALCVICCDDYDENDVLNVLPCEHHFHAECLKTWFGLAKLCPICKRNVEEMLHGVSATEAET
ncbi:hypothetical protein AMAG_01875 [Allomyces macrogynus ATCC 38327]|uniref:RING-type E3 ubiquitin transferase n=1 Tax=Allomyces macrogynus (strain ATCC 38327) TaxID=578462 RepID=A0A0L0S0X4_ALLM3|nr:hypothetical protein AMAG_01875 [Allomyces macrogynus ATCC 38327]|eukprot:KNE56031.1 hypothetical protein AMAG_01875 [Allomyces macrogynus ATCC 38327]